MASSEDEGEPVPHTVSNYHFDNEKSEPISFSELPIAWDGVENPDSKRKQIFLHGTADNGLQKLYKQVTAWKFDLSAAKPEILVLCKDKNWIKLQKPRKSFEDIIRSILITVHCLHFIAKNPETSARSLWDHLSKLFSSYETRPSEIDLVKHMGLISEAVERNENLTKSKVLVTLLEEKPTKRKTLDEVIGSTAMSGFIVNDDLIDEIEEDASDEEDDLFDSVCSICDNGGELLCCEGRCMRSFHATAEAGSESECKSLGLSDEQVEAIQNFVCKNCQCKQHQCFACGELASSDKLSGAEVFPCVSATCGRFYHPRCVANLLGCDSAAEVKIAAGNSFTCPVHKCHTCNQGEDKMDPELQFAVCRRCPKSYHKKCLPRKIAFEDLEDEGIIQRAWEGLIPHRILIYCLDHDIDEDLGTPVRDHIKFPRLEEKKKKQVCSMLSDKEKFVSREKSQNFEVSSGKRIVGKSLQGVEMLSSANKDEKSEKRLSALDSLKKKKVIDPSRKHLTKDTSTNVSKTIKGKNDASLGEQLYAFMNKSSEQVKSRKEEPADSEHEQTLTAKPVIKELPLDAESKRRIMALVKDVSSSTTLEEIIAKHKAPSTHASSSNYVVAKSITLGKVEGSIEALRAALQKLEEGCSNEDAKAVCEPGNLKQMIRWKNKLKVYLAPFLHGMRYTSFGRHFTKVDKLKEIVDILHFYVQDGDTIVDFCCGANDFSCLMKKKLDATGKKCFYKNYDVLRTKNDFEFEQRDWMTVQTNELPKGSRLIMGLNPPFGVNGALANMFINKALEFKPKLVILIVPPETERLDKKRTPYDLVWEDGRLLSGSSFYLPGSVDVNDKQMDQWNHIAPPLYLWSHPDKTAEHKAIAQQHGHTSRTQENHLSMLVDDDNYNPMEDSDGPPPVTLSEKEDIEAATLNGAPTFNNIDREAPENNDHRKRKQQSDGKPKKKRRRTDGKGRGSGTTTISSSEDKANRSRQGSPLSEKHRNTPPPPQFSPPPPPPKVNVPERSPPRKVSVPEPSPPKKISSEDRSRQRSPLSEQHRSLSPRHSPPSKARVPQHSPPRVPPEKQPFPAFGLSEELPPGYGNVDAGGASSQFQAAYDVARTDEVTKRYSLNSSEDLYGTGIHRWSSPGSDYAFRSSADDHLALRHRESSTVSHVPMPYSSSDVDDVYRRESAVRSRGQPYLPVQNYSSSTYGTPGYSSTYLTRGIGSAVGELSPYGRLSTSTLGGSPAESPYSRNSASATQRYAPKLDELNHTRLMGNPQTGLRGVSGHVTLSAPPPPPLPPHLGPPGGGGFQPDSIGGFASVPYHSYSKHHSAGWLNED